MNKQLDDIQIEANTRLARVVFILICTGFIGLWLLTPHLIEYAGKHNLMPSADSPGVFGDQFGSINSLFTGLAFVALLFTIYQQSHDLKIQQSDLALSLEEMRKSADAQTAQVRINTLSSLLSSLPLLIREEENRVNHIASSSTIGSDFTATELEGKTLDELKYSLSHFQAGLSADRTRLSDLEERVVAINKDIATIDERNLSDTINASATSKNRVSDAIIQKQYELREVTEKIAPVQYSIKKKTILSQAISRLIHLREELKMTYDSLHSFREWKQDNNIEGEHAPPEGRGEAPRP